MENLHHGSVVGFGDEIRCDCFLSRISKGCKQLVASNGETEKFDRTAIAIMDDKEFFDKKLTDF